MKILIINGPNLNLLGQRETNIYGNISFEDYFEMLKLQFTGLELEYYQSNVEGEIINRLHEADLEVNGVILNAGGYTHTSVAIGDAVKSVSVPVVEVHVSNIFSREDFRHTSFVAPHCAGTIIGFGLDSYYLAVEYFKKIL
jgi:3-dehydroquinate dehydratase-2